MGKVTFLGVEGSGKTVLTMAIAEAFREHEAEGFSLRPDTRESFRFLVQNPSGLFHGEGEEGLPHQTTRLKYLKWTIMHQGKELRTFDTLDYPGEIYRLAFLDAKDSTDPDEFKERFSAHEAEVEELLGHLTDSELVFVLFNLSDALDLAHNPDNLDAVWVTNACLGYLQRLPQKPRFVLLLTQIDRYISATDEAFDVHTFLQEKLPLIANNYPDLEVLAVSALKGGDGIHSITRVVFEALQETEPVKHFLANQRKPKEMIEKAKVRSIEDLAAVCATAQDIVEHPPMLAMDRPWFVDEWQMKRAGLFFSEDEAEEMSTILSEVREAVRRGKNKQQPEEAVAASASAVLTQVIVKTPEGRRLTTALAERVKKVEKKTEEARRNTRLAMGFIGSIAVLLLLGWWGVLVIKGKEYLAKALACEDNNRAAEWFLEAASCGNAEAQRKLGMLYALGQWKPSDWPPEESQQAKQAVKRVRKMAEHGNAEAQYALGKMYLNGREGEQSSRKAAEWLQKAAEQGNAEAQYALGEMYLNGQGVEQSDRKAAEWLQQAAEQGNAEAQVALGMLNAAGRWDPEHDSDVEKWVFKAANWGDPAAQKKYVIMVATGKWAIQDSHDTQLQLAEKWCLQTDAEAQYAFGLMYADGREVPKDGIEAVKWMRQSAEKGNSEALNWLSEAAREGNASAQYALGMLYSDGRGVQKDGVEALKWMRKASAQGLVEAVQWIHRAAESSNPEAQYALGLMYMAGRGVPNNTTEAVRWMQRSAEAGNAEATLFLHKAANQEIVEAQYALGLMYAKGYEGTSSDGMAIQWLHKAAEQGRVDAQYALGMMYAGGRGVNQSDEEAKKWLSKAREQGNAEAKSMLQRASSGRWQIEVAFPGGQELEMVACPEVGRDFWMGQYEITQSQFQSVMGYNPSHFSSERDSAQRPVEQVSWNDCQEFVEKLNALPCARESGLTFRLPTAEEWAMACRAGAPQPDAWHIDKMAQHGSSNGGTSVVGGKWCNSWKLYDMLGNVWEWTATAGPDGATRINCGGGWSSGFDFCKAESQFQNLPDTRRNNLGFRLCASGRNSGR